MGFRVDLSAPTMPDDTQRLTRPQVEGILAGAHLIHEHFSDNDMERWLLTRAGQFIRQTGVDGGRYHVWPHEEAFDCLAGIATDDEMNKVRDVLSEAGIEIPQHPTLRM